MTDDDVDRLLSEFRDDVPELDQRVFAAGRARLLAHVGAPRPTAVEPIDDDPVVRPLPPNRRRGSPRGLVIASVAAGVALIAVGALVILPDESNPGPAAGPPTTAPSTAPSTTAPPESAPSANPSPGRPGDPMPAMPDEPLNSAGDLADEAENLTVPPGQVHYVRLARSQLASTDNQGGTDVIETWIPADRGGEWMLRRTASGSLQGRPENDFEEKRAPGGRFEDGDAPWWVTPDTVADWPRDPEALYEKLRTKANAPLPEGVGTTQTSTEDAIGEVFSMLADGAGGLPADLRAALLETVGYLPNVTVTPDGTTTDGRPAVVLAYPIEEQYRNEILLDPDTARPVEWRNVALKAFLGYEPGQTFTSEAYTESIVSKLGEH